VVTGVCIASLTGFVENKPSGVIIPENKYYGFPMIWRISDVFAGEKFLYLEFFVNCTFWVAIVAILILLATAISSRLTSAS
jgi:hypothetical protein